MADPVDPNETMQTPELPDFEAATPAAERYNNIVQNTSRSFKDLTSMVQQSGDVLKNLLNNVGVLSTVQEKNINLTQKQTDVIGLLSSVALGASKAFNTLGDSKGLSTFGGQIRTLVENAASATNPLTSLKNLAASFGIPIDNKIGNSIEKLKVAVLGGIEAFTSAADSALKLQHGYLQLGSSSGELGKIFDQSGPKLQSLNNIIALQAKMMIESSKATGATTETTAEYYKLLGQIPGSLSQQIRLHTSTGDSMNMLTAAMKVSAGTGQNFEQVINDLNTAFTTYGSTGEQALEFTNRISEVSQKFGIQIQDVRKFMNETSGSFKFLGNNVEGVSQIFNRFFSGLKDSGLSARSSIEIIENMTNSLSKMNVAQRAFLSARTGGPGGLVGAIQIEKMLREGKADDVMRKVETVLKQQFGGRIISQDEAVKSEGAAAQYQRQRMMLTSGAFGNIAQNEEQATRLLEALSKPQTDRLAKAEDLFRTNIDRGTEVEKQSLTQLNSINANTEYLKLLGGIRTLDTTQKAFTARSDDEQLRNSIIGSINNATKQGSDLAGLSAQRQQMDRSNLFMNQTLGDLKKGFKELPQSFNSAIKTGSDMLKPSDQQRVITDSAKRDDLINQAKNNAQALAQAKQMQQNEAPIRVPTLTAPINSNINRAGPNNQNNDNVTTTANTTSKQTFDVTFRGLCVDCGKKMIPNPQMSAITNAPGVPNTK